MSGDEILAGRRPQMADEAGAAELRDAVDVASAVYDEKARHANDLLLGFVLEQFQEEEEPGARSPAWLHLAACPTARVSELDARDGSYGCDTGCDWLSLTAVITCDCDTGQVLEYEYGEFGEIASLIASLMQRDGRG